MLKGDPTEQQGAAILFVTWIAWNFALAAANSATVYFLFAMDLVEFAAFVGLAWTSRRSWAIVAALLQSIGIIAYFARGIGVDVEEPAITAALRVAALGVRFALIAGTFVAWREREALKSFGIDPQASTSSPASARSMSSRVRATPKMATKDPNRGPWF